MSARDSFATETGQTTYQKGNAADSRRRMNRQRNNVNCNRKSTARRKKKGSSKKRSSKKLKRWKEGLILQKSRQS
jgi:Ni/Co efflux regulator RcnB